MKRDLNPPGIFRMTAQRRTVMRVLTDMNTHPTVREVYEETKKKLKDISLATIYNTLETLRKAGMVNEHRVSGGAARFCVNRIPHAHMMDETSGMLIDVKLRDGVKLTDVFELPEGTEVTALNAYLYGTIPSTQIDI